jgi:opacity protein-like surface antigen
MLHVETVPQPLRLRGAGDLSMPARKPTSPSSIVLFITCVFALANPPRAEAQGFISPSFGYNFGGDSGCLEAFDCENKNWNFGISAGALGSIVGFEAEWLNEPEFLGKTPIDSSEVMTVMGNFMLAPRISVVQPYGLIGIGLMRTTVNDALGAEESENQIGWDIGGGLMVFVHPNIGIKGDIRYYHSFEVLDLFGIELNRDDNKLDFGRAAFGVVFKF